MVLDQSTAGREEEAAEIKPRWRGGRGAGRKREDKAGNVNQVKSGKISLAYQRQRG